MYQAYLFYIMYDTPLKCYFRHLYQCSLFKFFESFLIYSFALFSAVGWVFFPFSGVEAFLPIPILIPPKKRSVSTSLWWSYCLFLLCVCVRVYVDLTENLLNSKVFICLSNAEIIVISASAAMRILFCLFFYYFFNSEFSYPSRNCWSNMPAATKH